MPSNQDIIDYYAFSKLDYRLYNGRWRDIYMRYGIWDQSTHNHRQALVNENRVIAALTRIGRGDHVLDLGCGYGSTAVWLAGQIGCHVAGVTLSEDQVHDARALARRHRVEHLVTFAAVDFHHLSFGDNTFDVAISIESISHSPEKIRVLQEAWRVLVPGGRLGVADGFFRKDKDALTAQERALAQVCFEGVHVPPVAERRDFAELLAEAGFSRIRWRDETSGILPTARKVHRLGKLLLPISAVCSHFGVHALSASHMKAFINQYYAFRDGLGVYGTFCATKPAQVSSQTRTHRDAPDAAAALMATH
jgi:cyclopropane fatty-acyl-phospholipid synthase-like methyltransferase